jgi:hypothetical protein
LEEELPVLFIKRLDDRKFVCFKFLVFGGMGIIMSPLFQGDEFADIEDEPAIYLIKVIDYFKKIKYNGHEQCFSFVFGLVSTFHYIQKRGSLIFFFKSS